MAGDVSIVLPQHNREVIEHSINVNSFSYGERGKTKALVRRQIKRHDILWKQKCNIFVLC